MTTIAFDGKTLAADTQASGDHVWETQDKIRVIKNPITGDPKNPPQYEIKLCAGAGYLEDAIAFFNWIESGGDKPKLDEGFTGIKIENGVCTQYHDSLVGFEKKPPLAFGSGSQFAIAAMYCGKTAEEAVELAIKLDANTGGDVVTLGVEEFD